MKDFNVHKFYTYNGPNFYLNTQALVFNLYVPTGAQDPEYYKQEIIKFFPALSEVSFSNVADLYAQTLLHVLKMDIHLFIDNFSVGKDDDDFVIAVEYLDRKVAKDATFLVSDWFAALTLRKEFDFAGKYLQLQAAFDKSLFGGPTLYSLIEAGFRLDIPVFYLFEENEFQWGYGKKQLRGWLTTFHTDGIKDTEFTMFKDMVGDFLDLCGFPTPKGKNCFDENETVEEAIRLGFPVVVKPVAGHKGQGVTTGIMSEEEVRKAYQKITIPAQPVQADGNTIEGVLVQKQIYGTDHRLLAVGGKFVAALERVAAFVDGNGKDDIEKLIETENAKELRLDNARSPLCKIKIDDNLTEFLQLQGLSLQHIPKEGERITLRRVANISAGGVSINVTENIHPDNIKLVEDIAGYFTVKCLGIDVLAEDISKPWYDGNFGIIEINAGPGVFMHLAPAYGGSIDVPKFILESHFRNGDAGRIPIIAGNQISQRLADFIFEDLHKIKPGLFVGTLTDAGVYFNGRKFHKHAEHDQNVKMILRNPQCGFALFSHNYDNIYDFGILHKGADIVILEEQTRTEDTVLRKQMLMDSIFIQVEDFHIEVFEDGRKVESASFKNDEEKDRKLARFIEPYLEQLVKKYD